MSRYRVSLSEGADLEGFRKAARALMAEDIPPEDVAWTSDAVDELFGATADDNAPPLSLPRAVHELIRLVVCHRDPARYALLYTLIWRLKHSEPALLDIPSDPVVHRLMMMRKAIGRDLHKMHAFLRFRRVEQDGQERFAAWFEPAHFILDPVAPFFVERFRSLIWSIVTPVGSLQWNGVSLAHGPAGKRDDVPGGDPFEDGWVNYYASTYNPARVNPTAMRTEMPKKYWRNMPESVVIPALTNGTHTRTTKK